jgi:hypothetical protein
MAALNKCMQSDQIGIRQSAKDQLMMSNKWVGVCWLRLRQPGTVGQVDKSAYQTRPRPRQGRLQGNLVMQEYIDACVG